MNRFRLNHYDVDRDIFGQAYISFFLLISCTLGNTIWQRIAIFRCSPVRNGSYTFSVLPPIVYTIRHMYMVNLGKKRLSDVFSGILSYFG